MTELFLIARLAGQWVAVAADQVESVVDIGDIVTVPCVERSVRGLAALRSRVVTVIDTNSALGFEASGTTPSKRAIITVHDGHYYAVTVDALDDVAPFTRLDVAGVIGPRSADAAGWNHVGVGLITRNDEPMLIVDLARLVPVPLSIAG